MHTPLQFDYIYFFGHSTIPRLIYQDFIWQRRRPWGITTVLEIWKYWCFYTSAHEWFLTLSGWLLSLSDHELLQRETKPYRIDIVWQNTAQGGTQHRIHQEPINPRGIPSRNNRRLGKIQQAYTTSKSTQSIIVSI